MLEVKSAKELRTMIPIPILFENSQDRFSKIQIQIFDLSNSTVYSEDLTVKSFPNKTDNISTYDTLKRTLTYQFSNYIDRTCFTLTFEELSNYLDENSIVRLKELLERSVAKSSLYNDTLHCIQLTFIGSKTTKTIKRYCVFKSLLNEQQANICNISISDYNADVIYAIKNNSIMSLKVLTVARCTYSDSVLYEKEYGNYHDYLSHHVDISNFELDEVSSFAFGRFLDGSRKLLCYSSQQQFPILRPKITFVKAGTSLTDSGKSKFTDFSIKIESNVWNGFEHNDFGNLFLKNSIRVYAEGIDNVIHIQKTL